MPEKSRGRFIGSQATIVVLVLRCLIIVFTHCVTVEHSAFNEWLTSDALSSILIKPNQSLPHIREARAIQELTGGSLSAVYTANQAIHLPPLLVALLEPLLEFSNPEVLLAIALLLMDVLIAHMMEIIGLKLLLSKRTQAIIDEEQEQTNLPDAIKPRNDHIFAINMESKPLIPLDSLPSLAAKVYLWSPICILSGSVYSCFQNVPAFLLITAFHEFFKVNGSTMLVAYFLALASYVSPHHCVFLLPMILFQSEKQYATTTHKKVLLVLYFLLWSTVLQWLSYRLVGPNAYWDTLEASYGSGWNTVGPSLSVQW